LLVGTVISYWLMGAYTVQLHRYIKVSSKQDGVWIHSIVAGTAIIELLHLVFMSHTAYTVLAPSENFDFAKAPWTSAILPTFDGLGRYQVKLVQRRLSC
jgi:hypothetical protein